MFKVGDKVKCIDTADTQLAGNKGYNEHNTYVVTEVSRDNSHIKCAGVWGYWMKCRFVLVNRMPRNYQKQSEV